MLRFNRRDPSFLGGCLAIWAVGLMANAAFAASVGLQTQAQANRGASSFYLYDALLYQGKPTLTGHPGMAPIKVVYAGTFWEPGESREYPNVTILREVAQRLDPSVLTAFDIEHWPLVGSDEVVQASMEKYATVMDVIHEELPAIEIGYYNRLPQRSYWAPLIGPGSEEYKEWKRVNDRIRPLASHVDAVFPSLYAFENNPERWITYARENIKEAQQYGKPVYPYIWPEFHDSTPLAGEQIPSDFWRTQLETVEKYADGAVLWGGWQRTWDPEAPWWQVTQEFLDSRYPVQESTFSTGETIYTPLPPAAALGGLAVAGLWAARILRRKRAA